MNSIATSVSPVTSLQFDDFDIAEITNGSSKQVSDRYNEIIIRSGVAQLFSEAELNAFRDCCRGTSFGSAFQINDGVLINFEDSLIDGNAEKWEIDASATIAKLRVLSYPDQVVLVEDIEKFWREARTESRIDEVGFEESNYVTFEITRDRYNEIIRRADITQRFSEGELNAFRDCCCDSFLGSVSMIDGLVWSYFEESLYEGIAEKWDIDASTTIAKLCKLTYPDQVALVDNIEKYWGGGSNAEHGL